MEMKTGLEMSLRFDNVIPIPVRLRCVLKCADRYIELCTALHGKQLHVVSLA